MFWLTLYQKFSLSNNTVIFSLLILIEQYIVLLYIWISIFSRNVHISTHVCKHCLYLCRASWARTNHRASSHPCAMLCLVSGFFSVCAVSGSASVNTLCRGHVCASSSGGDTMWSYWVRVRLSSRFVSTQRSEFIPCHRCVEYASHLRSHSVSLSIYRKEIISLSL